jgi:hypothetical protein
VNANNPWSRLADYQEEVDKVNSLDDEESGLNLFDPFSNLGALDGEISDEEIDRMCKL